MSLRDTQQEPPICFCPRCGGEVYRYDQVGGGLCGCLVHEDCMTPDEQEEFPIAPAISFYCEEC